MATHLELGTIIQINSETNPTYQDNTYLITYIDSSRISLLNDTTFETIQLNIDDGAFEDESIESVVILSRPEEKGYARQNGLVKDTWIDIHFGGEVPTVFTGVISDLEEDMIELKLYSDGETNNQVIYIDFAYKGIPENLPIEKIQIRNPPAGLVTEKKELSPDVKMTVIEEEKSEDIEDEEVDEMSFEIPVDVIRGKIKDVIAEADDLVLGDFLGAVTQEVYVPESERRYDISEQTEDLLNELLSKIPNSDRTLRVMNNLNQTITRFKQLRTIYSNIDERGVVTEVLHKEADHKPLVDKLCNLHTNLKWILPVVSNKRKVYDVDDVTLADTPDVVSFSMAVSRDNDTEYENQYYNGSASDDVNKYNRFIRSMSQSFTPFEAPEDSEEIIHEGDVQSDLIAVIDNLISNEQSLYSTIVDRDRLRKQRFVIERYNLGINFNKTNYRDTFHSHEEEPITQSDKAHVKGFLMLPKQFVAYSHITLPGTPIFEKANLNKKSLQYWSLLRKSSSVVSEVVDSTANEIDYDGTFLEEMKYITFDTAMEEDDKYKRFVRAFIPKTNFIFDAVKETIRNGVDYTKVIRALEPFLIYNNEIVYTEFKQIRKFVADNIERLMRHIAENEPSVNKLRNWKLKTLYSSSIVLQLLEKSETKDDILSKYGLEEKQLSGEVLRKIITTDYGKLYMNSLSLLLSSLYSDINIREVLEEKLKEMNSLEETKDDESCATMKLVKYYMDFDELQDDNGKDVYYDKKYDETRYDILSEYKDQQDTMSEEEFLAYLVAELQMNVGMKEEDAQQEADALIHGKRKVRDGEYAVFETFDGEGNILYYVYERRNDMWNIDETKTTNEDITMQSYFCSSQQRCLSVNEECLSTDSVRRSLDKSITKDIVNSIMDQHIASNEETKRVITTAFEYDNTQIQQLKQLFIEEMFEYSTTKYNLGLTMEASEERRSPYNRLRDLILGQQDFVKRQNNMRKFIAHATRGARVFTTDEDENWLYCKKTDVKLLPSFYSTLAYTPLSNYEAVLDVICKERGVISDDGDKWVDKHSGYTIRFIDFDVEEGYEDGFKVSTREVLEEDAYDVAKKSLVYESKKETIEMRYIKNIIASLSHSMGVNIDSSHEFIIKNVLLLIHELHGDKAAYNAKKKASKKKMPTYEDKLHQFLLYFTGLFVLLSVQTAVPSIRTKKTYPNCKRSFDGFPMNEDGDYTGLEYVACIMKKTSGGSEPWNSIRKLKEESLVKNMKVLYNRYVSTMGDVEQRIAEKQEHMKANPQSDHIPSEVGVERWTTFLPPLQRIHIDRVDNVNALFQDEFKRHLQSGNKEQTTDLFIIKSKILFKSLEIIREINKIVEKEDALLETKGGEPFLENACCETGLGVHTRKYFVDKNREIGINIEDVKQLTNVIHNVADLTRSAILYSDANTKIKYPSLSTQFSEKTIYQGFITFCKINKNIPLPSNIQPYCLDNKSGFTSTNTLQEKIQILRSEGKNFSYEAFTQLLTQVNKNRMLQLSLEERVSSQKQLLEEYLQNMNMSETHINVEFEQKLLELLDSFTVVKEDEDPIYDALLDYVAEANSDMFATLNEFLQTRLNIRQSKKDELTEFIKKIGEFESHKASDIHTKEDNTFVYKKEFLHGAIKQLVEDIPNMIEKKVNFEKVKIPSHWNLSKRHAVDIQDIIAKDFSVLRENYESEQMIPVLKEIQSNHMVYLNIVDNIPFMYTKKIGKNVVQSMFNQNIVTHIYVFIIYSVLTSMIDTLQKNIDMDVDSTISGAAAEELARSDASLLQEELANLIHNICSVFMQHKKQINTNKQTIMETLMIIRDTEKDRKTRYLKDLTDEERQVDTAFKHMKLGRWSKGMEKGLTQYVRETYDEERNEAEREALLDLELSANMNVSDMNRDIYRFEAFERKLAEQEISDEAYDMSALGDDDELPEGYDGDEY